MKRTCSAEVVETILFEEPADLGGRFCRGLGRGQPTLDFGSEILCGRDGIDFEADFAEELQQFADRKRAHVGRIAENLPLVLIGGALRVFAGVNVFDQDGALWSANAGHFAEHGEGLLKMMESETANDYVEAGVFESEMLRVSSAEGDVC